MSQTAPAALAPHLEAITRIVFEHGLSPAVVERRWEGFRELFAGFDPVVVAAYTSEDVDRLATDERIIRNRRKIEATVANAAALRRLDAEHPEGYEAWLDGHASPDDASTALQECFRRLGPGGAISYLTALGRPAPELRPSRATTPGAPVASEAPAAEEAPAAD